jgi:serine protease Do
MSTRKSILTAGTIALIVTGFVGLSALGGALLASDRFARILPAGEWPRIGVDDGSAEYGISWAGDRFSNVARRQSEAKDRLADVVESVRPAVVSVTAKYLDLSSADGSRGVGLLFEGIDPRGDPRTLVTSRGTGFLVSADGYVVTNHHVVEASRIAEVVTDDGTTYRAKVTASDPRSDLALLKIDGRNDFPFAKLAERPPRVGQRVFAIGNPFGFDGSVTAGIVSARERHVDIDTDDDFIQIDAPINRGNSGGPTFDLDGNVVGVNTVIFSPSGGSVGIGFAIPAQKVGRVIAQLKAAHTVGRGWLGVRSQPVTLAIAEALGLNEAHGALVDDASGPAADVGIVPGDVISSINMERIKDNFDLARRLETLAPGITVHLGVVHDGTETTIAVVLGEAPPSPGETATAIEWPASPSGAVDLGLTLAPAAPSRGGDKVPRSGVVVLAVQPNGRGADLGISPGDIIIGVNGKPVQTPDEIPEALQDAYKAGRSATLMRLKSGDMTRFIAVPFDPA